MRTFAYDPSGSFRGWLKTLAHHAWHDFVKKRDRAGAGSGDTGVLDQLGTVEARADLIQRLEEPFERELLDEAHARVRRRVKPHFWEAFRLLALEGCSGSEAAAKLQIKVSAVFVARSKVQRMLKGELHKLEGPNPARERPLSSQKFVA
jgi:RNA polymerase sigma-70 factor (ECF subfamily)